MSNLTIEQVAEQLNGCEYGSEGSRELWKRCSGEREMSERDIPGLMFLLLAGVILSCLAVGCIVENAWEDSAKARGVMEYNQATGVLEWKAEFQRKDSK